MGLKHSCRIFIAKICAMLFGRFSTARMRNVVVKAVIAE